MIKNVYTKNHCSSQCHFNETMSLKTQFQLLTMSQYIVMCKSVCSIFSSHYAILVFARVKPFKYGVNSMHINQQHVES